MLNRLFFPFRFFSPRRRVDGSVPDSASPRPDSTVFDPEAQTRRELVAGRVSASLLARAQARFARSRPGSVLILVVALLVLMALIGTAFMSMAQSDRASAVLHENNTEIDLLVDGLINVVKGAIVTDLFSNGQYRPGVNYSTDAPNTYNNITGAGYDATMAKLLSSTSAAASPVSTASSYLASRLPELPLETSPGGSPTTSGLASPAPGGQMPFWRFITAPIVGNAFSSPYPPIVPNGQAWLDKQILFPPYSYTQRAYNPLNAQAPALYPWYITVNGTNMPAWVDNPTTTGTTQRIILAADADGDGVADSGLIKLPIGAINGITYYAAVRILDNSSAVNANVAWTHSPLATVGATFTAPQLPGDFFPTNIDLVGSSGREYEGLLVGTDATQGMSLLENYRYNGNAPSAYPPYTPAVPYDDGGFPRTDFSFLTPFELQWMQMGRRLPHPSLNPTGGLFTPLPISESETLASNFIIRRDSLNNRSILEAYLPLSLFDDPNNDPPTSNIPIPTSPYQAPLNTPAGSTIFQWYQANFAFLYRNYASGTPANNVPLRSILTTENGVSNFAPAKLTDLGQYATGSAVPSGGYQFGDMVTYPVNGQPHRFVCINPIQATGNAIASKFPPGPVTTPVPLTKTNPPPPPAPIAWQLDSDNWIYEPWTTSPTKINVNTATFGQLWLSYYQVMADQQNLSSGVRTWLPAYPPVGTTGTTAGTARMFRSPLRYVPQPTPNFPVGLTSMQVMQLRAALAAVNTIDMRDSDDNVSSRTVHLIDTSNLTPTLQDVTATVYGMERQPFITQVYATDLQYTDASQYVHNGFVAIELYNPYPQPIDLSNYTLAYANRSTATLTATTVGTTANLTFTPIAWAGTSTDPAYPKPTLPNQAPVIPPFSSIIIASGGVSATGGPLDPTSLPPTGAAPPNGNLAFDTNANVTPAVYPYPYTTPPNKTTPPQTYLYVLTGLCPQTGSAALGNELYLFRGRLENAGSTGLGTTNTIPPAPLSYFPPVTTPPATTQPTTPIVAGTLATQFNETSGLLPSGTNPADMVPVDSYDFTGLYPSAGFQTSPGSAHEWYYSRPNPMGAATKAWHFVYPGHSVMTNVTVTKTNDPLPRLVDGTVYSGGVDPTAIIANAPPVPDGIGNALQKAKNLNEVHFPPFELPLGFRNAPLSTISTVEDDTATLTYRDIPLELNAPDFGGPNAGQQRGSTPNEGSQPEFPFGGFARNGDILEVPYIGAYRLMIPATAGGLPTQIIEMNPPTMDSMMALGLAQPQWGDNNNTTVTNPIDAGLPLTGGDPIYGLNKTNNIAIEQVGRFCPIGTGDISKAVAYTYPLNDFFIPQGGVATSPYWLYHFGTRLFDYLTVQSPQLDMLPDVDPGSSDANSVKQIWEYGPTNTNVADQPAPVANVNGAVFNAEPGNQNGATEETATVQGLVNINTAPWRVLASIPWVPPTYSNRVLDNVNIALSIVYYRDVNDGTGSSPLHGHGPFKSIFELGSVKIYNIFTTADVGSATGTYLRDILTLTPPSTSGSQPNAVAEDEGDLTAVYPNTLFPVVGDFKSQYQMINRVSNLITTRSDSFTAYVLLQGWRNAETPGATLAVQRRVAFRIDRSGVTPFNPLPTVNLFPNQ